MDSTEIDEAIAHYYKLKGNYDKKYAHAKHSIFSSLNDDSGSQSKKLARAKIKRIKRQCVNCKKNGGTIFSNSNGILTAKCGNKENPCPLDIQIKKPNIVSVDDALTMIEDYEQESKANIINLKLDLLFGLRTEEEITPIFEEEKNNYKTNIKQKDGLNHVKKAADEVIYENPHTQEEQIISVKRYIKIKQKEMNEKIIKFKQFVKEYMTEDDVTLQNKNIKSATNIYIEHILPLMKKIREEKHALTTMIYENEEFRMIKLKYMPNRFEIPYESGEIISNIK